MDRTDYRTWYGTKYKYSMHSTVLVQYKYVPVEPHTAPSPTVLVESNIVWRIFHSGIGNTSTGTSTGIQLVVQQAIQPPITSTVQSPTCMYFYARFKPVVPIPVLSTRTGTSIPEVVLLVIGGCLTAIAERNTTAIPVAVLSATTVLVGYS